jgi:arylsulfatase A-like enzyme
MTFMSLRRLAIAVTSGFLLASVAACTGSPGIDEGAGAERRRPNILVIMTDDQPVADTLRVMPRTRRWFQEGGTTFTETYATTPLCCPSRASFFSGRYAHNHDVIRSTPGQADKLDQDATLQRYLQEAGYRTAIFGKYLNHWDLGKDPPHFDEWAIIWGGKPLGYYTGPWNVNGKRKEIPTYSTTYIQRRALEFVESAEQRDDQPWLMFVHVYAPHLPFLVPERYEDASLPEAEPGPAVGERDVSDKPPFARRMPDAARLGSRLREEQLRTLLPVDRLVGKLMSSLKQAGEGEDTLAFYTSDNGYIWGEHRLIKKSTPYTASVRIPLLARWPGRIEAGVEDGRIAGNIDLAPTVYDAVGIQPDPDLPVDGISLLSERQRQDILLEYWPELPDDPSYVPWRSLRTAEYQYVEYYEQDLETVRFREYYDLVNDPWQLENLFGDRDASNDPNVQQIARRMNDLRRCAGDSCR